MSRRDIDLSPMLDDEHSLEAERSVDNLCLLVLRRDLPSRRRLEIADRHWEMSFRKPQGEGKLARPVSPVVIADDYVSITSA